MHKLLAILLVPLLFANGAFAQAALSNEDPPIFESLAVGKTRFELQFAPGLDVAGRREVRAKTT